MSAGRFAAGLFGEHVILLGFAGQRQRQHPAKGFRQWHLALLVALADHPNVLSHAIDDADMLHFQAQGFADPQPGLLEQLKQQLVALAYRHREFTAAAKDVIGNVVIVAGGFRQRGLLFGFQPDRNPAGAFGLFDLVNGVFADLVVALGPFIKGSQAGNLSGDRMSAYLFAGQMRNEMLHISWGAVLPIQFCLSQPAVPDAQIGI